MPTSKMISLRNFIALSAVAVFMQACTKANTKPDGVNGPYSDDASATFVVKDVTGEGSVTSSEVSYINSLGEKEISSWAVPRVASFLFTACIEDLATGKDARGHQFEVEIPDSKQQIADIKPTNPNGCFNWTEEIPFSYFVQHSGWVIIDRDIIGTGVHQGRKRVQIAINPWALGANKRDGGEKEVRFWRDEPINKKLVLQSKTADEALGGDFTGPDELLIQDAEVQVLRTGESETGTGVQVTVTMYPKVVFKNAAGEPQNKPLTTGIFTVQGHLLMDHTGDNLDKRIILTSTPASGDNKFQSRADTPGNPELVNGSGRVIDGKLVARFNAFIGAKVAQGNLQLAIKLIPKGIQNLKAAEGIYDLGTVKNPNGTFKGNEIDACREGGVCDVASYVHDADNFQKMYEENEKKQRQVNKNFPYLFDPIRLRFVKIATGSVEEAETATQRTVVYSASTCVTDAFTGDRPVGMNLTVNYLLDDGKGNVTKGPDIPVTTRANGCIYWDAKRSHYYYQPEKFYTETIEISKGSTHVNKIFHLNPWDDKFTFGFDDEEFTPQFWADQEKRTPIPSRFFLSEFGYKTIRMQYDIDSLLSLFVKKMVLMELRPRALRYSGIINARKMTEQLRDGVWMVKAAFQKSYLDPSQPGVWIDPLKDAQAQIHLSNEPKEKTDSRVPVKRLRDLGIKAPTKEFITSYQTLSRVTDGVIIRPIEFVMQDLRLMRIRSNFMIELQAIDERKLQAENVASTSVGDLAAELSSAREALNQDELETRDEIEAKGTSIEDQIKLYDQKAKDRMDHRVSLVRQVFDAISDHLDHSPEHSVSLDVQSFSKNDQSVVQSILDGLGEKLKNNDFTDMTLPSCKDADCDRFLQPEEISGLARRSFVGPVIFLNNSYSDSMRATDNLDDSCGVKINFKNDFEKDMYNYQRQLFYDAKIANPPQNTSYTYSEYFGSLRHLCNAQVDELIAQERETKDLFNKNKSVLSSMYNYAKGFSLDFLSFAGEVPQRVDITPENIIRCHGDLVSCQRPDKEFSISPAKAEEWLGHHKAPMNWSMDSMDLFYDFYWDQKNRNPYIHPMTLAQAKYALFGKNADPVQARYAACVLTSAHMFEFLKHNGRQSNEYLNWQEIEEDVVAECMTTKESPIFMDKKLRVFATGQGDDSYVFKGGLQLNLNVNENISVSDSNGFSWGEGIELQDTIGSIPIIGQLTKPLSLKVGASQGTSESNGTSISTQTYIVAQVAKMRIKLDQFEECYMFKFSNSFMDKLFNYSGDSNLREHMQLNRDVLTNPGRKLFVCSGDRNAEPRNVDELYFYFTQHFTEGDMLDQADLYNHPWLLGLRGQRDFATFLTLMRAQEIVDWQHFIQKTVDNITGNAPVRDIKWPLKHMAEVYRKTVPTFPGIYTVLEGWEDPQIFPLENRLNGNTTDYDVNGEVFGPSPANTGN